MDIVQDSWREGSKNNIHPLLPRGEGSGMRGNTYSKQNNFGHCFHMQSAPSARAL